MANGKKVPIGYTSIYDEKSQSIPIGRWCLFYGCVSEVCWVTKRPGCYAIYLDSKLVYIGQCDNLSKRFKTHFKLLIACIQTQWGQFNSNRLSIKIRISAKYGEEAMVEKRLIRRLRPAFNKIGLDKRKLLNA